ncbi:TPA: hypothetical protein DEW47_01145 [Patescibacteria group bacterium]|nr:MAG: hypothetical protein UT71_C0006G0004 [Parcubacteria group bacterium GW2011_GWF2_40_10]KKR47326.1 MAG: hypothetical protein UT83_C0011G0010 [Parcubacteria group bacterium GW2011_GWA2_40_143]KKR59968.1 MAG: hypothetical protein UT97_C0007G0004 [Parcubacteria group bacterium GW2011_GWC2_40_31]KKR74612.1 MAG: hypothetical protein UU18_C0022G0003 [Parcubacteria group bacterium GW2011_GWB2_40_8]KKR83068.1 MAG: hypothetical protein UU28_C0004G0004 [Parcubacteria group bacterium GW2011_GWD2_40_
MNNTPDIKQYLPFYKENFKKDTRWLKKETEHYTFNYFPDSLAEKEVDFIAERQEKAFKKIISFLRLKPPKKKISYYLYPSKKTKKELMGDDWYAQSIYHDFCVHILYTSEIKPVGEHEDTHLLSLPWGLSIGFWAEGLAEYLTGHDWYGNSHNIKIREGFKRKIFPSIESLMSQKAWMDLPDENAIYYYCLAGSFTKFIIEKFGMEKFKELYKETSRGKGAEENKKVFKKIYGIDIDEAEQGWKKMFSN